MTSRDFCYWLQGYFEISGASKEPGEFDLDATQVELIQRHLALVFIHEIDPSAGPAPIQEKLNEIHKGIQSNPSGEFGDGKLFRC